MDDTWLCSALQLNETTSIGYCYNFLPKKSDKTGASYRFSTEDEFEFSGWKNITSNFVDLDISKGEAQSFMGAA